MKKHMTNWLCLALTVALALSLTVPAFAATAGGGRQGDITPGQEITAEGYTYAAPTSPISVADGIITASAHRAASPVLGMMGLNATSGFGMINGGAPQNLADAQTRFALGVWGTSLNDNPDPYYWNYFYNFYAAENGLPLSDDALINANVAASPGAADGNLQEEYGNVSYSLATRPEILVGVASNNQGGDTSGYDEQLATIHSFTPDSPYYHEGDENYNPQLVSYQMTTIKQMIESVKRIADAVDVVAAQTGKTTRYGDAQTIASDYETYVYGLIAYIHEELAAKGLPQKTFAFVTTINEDGTYTVGGADYNSATSLGRAYEYGISVARPLVTETTTMTKDQLLQADAIITLNNQSITLSTLLESFGDSEYNGITITNTPATLYGVTMNSVENAMGYAFVIGYLYQDILDVNPVELCAYFYNRFLHVSDLNKIQQIVNTNFANTVLPSGVSATLPADFSAEKIENQLVKGMQYYTANETYFDGEQFLDSGINTWEPNYTLGIGRGQADGAFGDVPSTAYYAAAVDWAVANGVTNGIGDTLFAPAAIVKRSEAVTFLWRANSSPTPATTNNPFADVPADSYYYNAVLWAVENGITIGTSETTFSPNDPVRYEDMLVMQWRAAGLQGYTGAEPYYADALNWAAAENLLTDSLEDFPIGDGCPRRDVVTFLYRDLAA